jgi:hypothetical protein
LVDPSDWRTGSKGGQEGDSIPSPATNTLFFPILDLLPFFRHVFVFVFVFLWGLFAGC